MRTADFVAQLSTLTRQDLVSIKEEMEGMSDTELKNIFSNGTVLTSIVQSVRHKRKQGKKHLAPVVSLHKEQHHEDGKTTGNASPENQ